MGRLWVISSSPEYRENFPESGAELKRVCPFSETIESFPSREVPQALCALDFFSFIP